MANILISYGDVRYYESVRRVIRQAKKTKFFDSAIQYTDKDLTEELKKSPLFNYTRGGGYWLWKPWIILDAIKHSKEGDVIVYVDGGCSLNPKSREWSYFEEHLKNHSAILFQYRSAENYPAWELVVKENKNFSSQIRYWTKPLCRKFLSTYFSDSKFLDYNSLWCGACIVKNCKEGQQFIQEWFNLMNQHPEIVRDMEGEELEEQASDLNAHRHDQPVVTALAYYRKVDLKLLIIPETSESQKDVAAIRADRFIQAKMPFWLNLKYRLYNLLHGEQ